MIFSLSATTWHKHCNSQTLGLLVYITICFLPYASIQATTLTLEQAKSKYSSYKGKKEVIQFLQKNPQKKTEFAIEELKKNKSDWSFLRWLMPQKRDRTANIAKTLTLTKTKEAF